MLSEPRISAVSKGFVGELARACKQDHANQHHQTKPDLVKPDPGPTRAELESGEYDIVDCNSQSPHMSGEYSPTCGCAPSSASSEVLNSRERTCSCSRLCPWCPFWAGALPDLALCCLSLGSSGSISSPSRSDSSSCLNAHSTLTELFDIRKYGKYQKPEAAQQ